MKIYRTPDGLVDLEAPIWMSEAQSKKFIDFFKEIFPNGVIVEDRQEAMKEVHYGERTMKSWTIDDYIILLGTEHNEAIAKKLKRTTMSVQMRRGEFVPDFAEWLKNKGKSYKGGKTLVEQYLREREDAL